MSCNIFSSSSFVGCLERENIQKSLLGFLFGFCSHNDDEIRTKMMIIIRLTSSMVRLWQKTTTITSLATFFLEFKLKIVHILFLVFLHKWMMFTQNRNFIIFFLFNKQQNWIFILNPIIDDWKTYSKTLVSQNSK